LISKEKRDGNAANRLPGAQILEHLHARNEYPAVFSKAKTLRIWQTTDVRPRRAGELWVKALVGSVGR
jgi:hypothetical protein